MLLALPILLLSSTAINQKAIILLSNIALLQTWFSDNSIYFGLNATSWFLSLTMFFVLASSMVLRFWNKVSKKYVFPILVILYVVQFVITMIFNGNLHAHWIIYIFPITRLIDYMIGSGLYKFNKEVNMAKYFGRVATNFILLANVIGQIYLLCYIHRMNIVSDFLYVVMWTLTSSIFICFLSGEYEMTDGHGGLNFTKIFENKLLVLIGDYSFYIFLIHSMAIAYINYIIRTLGIQIYQPYLLMIYIIGTVICIIMWKGICIFEKLILNIFK